MPKMFVFTLGYNDFAVPIEDGPHVLAILTRMRQVKQRTYNAPHVFTGKESCVTALALVDVEDEKPEPPAPPPEEAADPLRIPYTSKIAAPAPDADDDNQPF